MLLLKLIVTTLMAGIAISATLLSRNHEWLKWKTSDKRTSAFRFLNRWLIPATVGLYLASCIQVFYEEKAKITDKARTEEREIQLTNQIETLKLIQGMHNGYPRLFFFRGSHHKILPAKAPTLPIVIENPNDYPIFDLEIRIINVLEMQKEERNTWSSKNKVGRSIIDDARNVLVPPNLITNFQIGMLPPQSTIQREIGCPSTGTNHVYYAIATARNGRTFYRYHFLGDPNSSEFIDSGLVAFRVLREQVEKAKNGISHKLKVVEEYHDPSFPFVNGKIDYGPPLLDFIEPGGD